MIAESNAPCGIDELVPLIRECVSCGKEVKMRVTGVSMTPTLINRRDCVVLAKADKIKKYDSTYSTVSLPKRAMFLPLPETLR